MPPGMTESMPPGTMTTASTQPLKSTSGGRMGTVSGTIQDIRPPASAESGHAGSNQSPETPSVAVTPTPGGATRRPPLIIPTTGVGCRFRMDLMVWIKMVPAVLQPEPSLPLSFTFFGPGQTWGLPSRSSRENSSILFPIQSSSLCA
jgi:hypothetical protein